jgi:hypothetical protein
LQDQIDVGRRRLVDARVPKNQLFVVERKFGSERVGVGDEGEEREKGRNAERVEGRKARRQKGLPAF